MLIPWLEVPEVEMSGTQYGKRRGTDHIQGTGLVQAVRSGVDLAAGLLALALAADESPIILPPEAAHSLDKRDQHEHADDTERKGHYDTTAGGGTLGQEHCPYKLRTRTGEQPAHLWSGCATGC